MLLIIFLMMEKKYLGEVDRLASCKYLKGRWFVFLLKEKNCREKTMTCSRESNSESWKPQNSESTVVSVAKCFTAPLETRCCLDFVFSQQKREKKMEMLNFLTALIQRIKKEVLSFSFAELYELCACI